MKALTTYIHAKGLKAGSTPRPARHLRRLHRFGRGTRPSDARKFADWGFDFLKYDWCSYEQRGQREGARSEPYRLMGDAAPAAGPRHRLQSLPVRHGATCGSGAARSAATAGGPPATWAGRQSRSARLLRDRPENARHDQYAGPGRWNDPDYILIGWVGDAATMGPGGRPRLTPDEQYSYMSMWCLMAAPLIFSGDMTKLDDFTLNVLCNAEVIEVDQDPLGRQAKIISPTIEPEPLAGPTKPGLPVAPPPTTLILAKPMEDGSLAVGLFNLASAAQMIAIGWKDLGIRRSAGGPRSLAAQGPWRFRGQVCGRGRAA